MGSRALGIASWCYPALCQRGAPAPLAGLLQRRLAPAPSLQVLARLLVAALADDEPGVRAPAAAALLALAMQPAARVRAALRDAGAVQALRRAAASRRGDAGLAGTLAAALARLAPQ